MSLEPLQSAPPQAIPLGSHLADEANHRIANHLAMLSALMRLQAKDVGRAQIALSANNVQGLLEEFAGRLDTVAKFTGCSRIGRAGRPSTSPTISKRLRRGSCRR